MTRNIVAKIDLILHATEDFQKIVPHMTIDEFTQAACYGKINSDIMAAIKKINHVRHVGLEKVKLLRTSKEEISLLQA